MRLPHVSAQLDYTTGRGVFGCPSARQFRDVMMGKFGYDPVEPGGTWILALHVTRLSPIKLHAEMMVQNDKGEQWHNAFDTTKEDCAEVVLDTASLVRIAAHFAFEPLPELPDPAAEAAVVPPLPVPVPVPPPPVLSVPAPSVPAPVRVPPPPKERSPYLPRFQLGAAGSFALFVTPSPALGPVFQVGARWQYLSVGVEGRALLALSGEVDGVPVRTSLFAGSVLGCGHGRVVFGCGRLEAGAMRFDTDIFSPDGQGYQATGGFAGRFGAEWKLTDELRLTGYFDLLFSFTKNDLRYGQDRPTGREHAVWTASPVSPSLTLGIVVQP
jgi:hypothetical protein